MLPNAADAESIQGSVVAEQGQILKQGLRREDAIERIFVHPFKPAGKQAVPNCYVEQVVIRTLCAILEVLQKWLDPS